MLFLKRMAPKEAGYLKCPRGESKMMLFFDDKITCVHGTSVNYSCFGIDGFARPPKNLCIIFIFHSGLFGPNCVISVRKSQKYSAIIKIVLFDTSQSPQHIIHSPPTGPSRNVLYLFLWRRCDLFFSITTQNRLKMS